MNKINEVINQILEERLTVKYEKTENGTTVYGFYYNLPKASYDEVSKMDRLTKLLYSCYKVGKNTMLGDTNKSDYENTFQQSIVFVASALYSVFSGERNDRVNKELRCNSIDDIYEILNDDGKLNQLCKYIYKEVQFRFKTLVKQKSNPDFVYSSSRGYTRIDYVYTDDDNVFLEIEEGTNEKKVGELTQYILDEYIGYLTECQQQFIRDVVMYNVDADGSITDFEGNRLYSKQLVYKYRKNISKALQDVIVNDEDIGMSKGRIFLRRL